ncbi:MAG: glycosyltransferase, partial [Emcibacter sp.]|nr:glycosyltransferase [Emcibacter sp.]
MREAKITNIVKQLDVGAVIIGRNEGERLRTCLQSLVGVIDHLVYVDSGSSDQSVSMAREMGVDVVELDLARPFTAARARNEGFQKLIQDSPELKYVQFVDGDCEIDPAWIGKASKFLKENNTVSVACGRRAERYPDKTIYNFLCDMEWNTPIGEAKSCGGDALMLVEAIKEVGGYNNDLIAGEEPELCYRLRHKGWRVWRIDEEMTLHDADLTRFSQWWVRAIRSGHAYAEGAYMYGLQEERFRVREI